MAVTAEITWWCRPWIRLIDLSMLFSVGIYLVSDFFRVAISSNGNVVAVASRMRPDLVGTFRAIADLQSRDPEVAATARD